MMQDLKGDKKALDDDGKANLKGDGKALEGDGEAFIVNGGALNDLLPDEIV